MTSDTKLHAEWEDSWKKNTQGQKPTIIGRKMFEGKLAAIDAVLPSLDVKTVLEAGCGSGHILQAYARKGYDCLGIDVSPTAVDICKNKGLRAENIAVEEETRTFDLVSSDGMLEHMLHFEPMVQEFIRLSKRYVLLFQPNHTSLCGRTLVYLAQTLRNDKLVYEYNYTMDDFIDVFAANGCVIRHNIPIFFDVVRLLLFERV